MKKIILSIYLLLCFTFITNAQKRIEKQDSVILNEFFLEDIIVTVNKTQERSLDIAGSLSTINDIEQDAKKITNLTDLTATTPNFHMPDYGTSLTTPVYIRGIGSKINEPAVGLYVDGIPYFEKASFDFNFYDIEQIEVLRGPQGTLYGRNTLGGIIRVHTTEPDNENSTKFKFSINNQSKKDVHLNQNINVSNSLNVNFGGQFSHHDGYYKNNFLNQNIGGEVNYSGRLKLNFSANDDLDFMFLLDGNSLKNNGYPYSNLSDSINDISYNRESSYEREMVTTGFKANLKTDNFIVKSVTSFQHLDDLQEIDQDFSPADLFFVNQDRNHNLFSQEFNISGEITDKTEIVAGAFGFYQLRDKQVDVFYGEDAVDLYDLKSKMEKDKTYSKNTGGFAFFGQMKQNSFLMEDLNLTLGLRYDYEVDKLNYTYNILMKGSEIPKADFDHQLDFSEWLPKLSFNYNWSNQFTQFFSVSKGYKSGGFNSTFEKPEDETFKPEYSWNYETGLKYRSRFISANLSLFYIDWRDQQVYQIDTIGSNGTTGPVLKNAAESVSKGVEVEFSVRPVNNVSTFFNAGYTHAKFEDYVKDPADNEDYSGNFIPYIPRYTFSTGMNYRLLLPNNLVNELRFNLSYNGIGKHYWNNENSIKEDYYGLLNASITGFIKNFQISFWGKNLTNTEYSVFMFESRNQRFAQKSLPLRLGISLKANFSNY